ncbi:MAG: hypothetical protein J7K66_05040 [Anaerolineaceae bacterium]|nr:hypothetical protein [Anaerolineaceae bacterium]
MRKEINRKYIQFTLLFIILVSVITTSTWYPINSSDRIRRYTRPFEFDYLRWEFAAGWKKLSLYSLGPTYILNNLQQRKIIDDYFRLLNSSNKLQQKIAQTYSDPQVPAPEKEALPFENELEKVNRLLNVQESIAESVLQGQIGQTLKNLGLANIGTPFPPILFQTTELPRQLIISPRDTIYQENCISLRPDMSLGEIIQLENNVEENLNYSALVVPIGGVSTYPTMVINTTDLEYLIETIAHEWTHNYLIFRPLGIRYDSSPELRTMNETTASISGTEISQAVIERFYPDLIKPTLIVPKTFQASLSIKNPFQQNNFNFSKEMYLTRIKVDDFLAKGEIEEAEQFMDSQRLYFWENGYHIRKLNQAYFAFHGAYADEPFGAAGKDPVGEDVRLLRAQQPSLASFIKKISWMYQYSQLRIAARAF